VQSLVPSQPPIVGTPGHHPGLLELASGQRASDVADVGKLGPAATAAYLAANPWLAYGIDQTTARMADSPLLTSLNQQAQDALARGGQLTPEEIGQLSQSARARFAASGLVNGNQAIGAELLSRDAATRQRLAAAQALATGVQGLNTQQTGLVQQGTNVLRNALPDPFQTVLGRPSNTSIMPVNQLFNPTNPYFQDLYNTNYNAQAAANIAGANNNAAITGAVIKSIGQVAGAAAGASDERLKTDIRVTGEKTSEGIPIKTWRYRSAQRTGSPVKRPLPPPPPAPRRRFKGVIAQDVEKAIRKGKAALGSVLMEPLSGFKVVDYSKIDAPMQFAV
jgi:hypothetical protein